MSRLLTSLLSLAVVGALLTGCAIRPPHLGGPVMVGKDQHHDNGRHNGQHKGKGKGKHGHND